MSILDRDPLAELLRRSGIQSKLSVALAMEKAAVGAVHNRELLEESALLNRIPRSIMFGLAYGTSKKSAFSEGLEFYDRSFRIPPKDKPMPLFKVNVKKLLAAMQAQAETNQKSYQKALDTFNTKMAEFTELARANEKDTADALSALRTLGVYKPTSSPDLYIGQIKLLQMIDGETIELDEDSELMSFLTELE